jgi:hypothetical protein
MDLQQLIDETEALGYDDTSQPISILVENPSPNAFVLIRQLHTSKTQNTQHVCESLSNSWDFVKELEGSYWCQQVYVHSSSEFSI